MSVLQDIRYALWGLWHRKGFAITAILCLGFGIGLNTAIFSIVDGVLLQPYPFRDPDGIVVLGTRHQKTGDEAGLSYADLVDWRAGNSSLSAIEFSSGRNFNLSDDTSADPERVLGALVSARLFSELGIAPILGKPIADEDDRPGAGTTALISHDLWTVRYHADPNIVGRSIRLDNRSYSIVGVMPPGFRFSNNMRIWVPGTPLLHTTPRDNRGLFAFGRLKPGVSREQAATDLSAVAARLAREYPATNEGWVVREETLAQAFVPPDVVRIIALMMGAVTLVLLVACSNVANLMLVRASVRRREFALRAALGAGRSRIVRQLLTESLALAFASLPLGVILAVVGVRMISSALPPEEIPYYIHFAVDGRTFTYSVAIAMLTALVFGLFPALQVSRGSLRDALEESARGATTGRSRLRNALVTVQVSLALVSLVGALLFVRTFVNIDRVNIGFDTTRLMSIRFSMLGGSYTVPDAKLQRVREIVEKVEALPGVDAAFGSSLLPLFGGGDGGNIEIDGKPADTSDGSGIGFAGTTPHFLRTLGTSVVAGRDFTDSEATSRSAVSVINESMARRFWGSPGAAIGRRFRLTNDKNVPDWFTVIGVMPNLRLYGIGPDETGEAPRIALASFAYQQATVTSLTVRVRSGDAAAITPSLRTAVREADPNMPLFQIRTIEEIRRLQFWEFGLYGWVFGTTGVVGLLLAAVGVYGVLSYSVEQRAREIGIRVALGAERRSVLRLIIAHGISLVGIGVMIGLVCAAVATPLAQTMLFGVSPFDPASFIGVAALLLLMAALASSIPALRATRVDPVVVLKGE